MESHKCKSSIPRWKEGINKTGSIMETSILLNVCYKHSSKFVPLENEKAKKTLAAINDDIHYKRMN